MNENIRRISLDQARKLKSLSNKKKFNELTEEEIDHIIENDPDLYQLTDEELAQFKLVRRSNNEKNNNKTRVTFEEAKKIKGRSNLSKLIHEQNNERFKKSDGKSANRDRTPHY